MACICRALLFEITMRYGLHLEQEPTYGGRAYLEKQDYIRMKQQAEIEKQGKRGQIYLNLYHNLNPNGNSCHAGCVGGEGLGFELRVYYYSKWRYFLRNWGAFLIQSFNS